MTLRFFSVNNYFFFKNTTRVSDGATFKRKQSSRKVTSNHRKSGAFLDVPPGDIKRLAEPEDPENSYRLRSFSFTSKGILLYLLHGYIVQIVSYRHRHHI